jgi:hypothetical protein
VRAWRYYGTLLSGWDAQFYYAQGRSIAFEGTLDITPSLEATPYKEPFKPDATGFLAAPPRRGGRIINKYPIGLSLCEIPFMLVGHAVNRLRGGPPDGEAAAGYSPPAILCVGLGLLLYTVVGLALLHLLLQRFYPFWPATLGVLAVWLGTSLFYYSAVFPFMAHGTAFALVVAVLWQAEKLRTDPEPRLGRWVLLALTFGLLFLVRPQQVLLLPVTAPFLIGPLARSRHPLPAGALAVGVFGAVCGLQLLANYSQLGRWALNAYAANNEGFDWLHPQWWIVLFSPSRGLFWINPIVIVALAAVVLLRPRVWVEYVVVAHGLVQAYLIACWSSPDQGDAFGPRMWIESTPLIAFGVAKLFARLSPAARWLGGTVYAGALAWTCILMALYIRGYLSSSATYDDILRRVVTLNIR